MAESFDPYYTWLGIPPDEQPADHYRLLGIRRFEANEEVIINATDQRMAFIRTFQTGKRAVASQDLLNEIAAAQTCLLNPRKKCDYDDALRRQCAQAAAPAPSAAALIAAALRSGVTAPPQPPAGDREPATWEIVLATAPEADESPEPLPQGAEPHTRSVVQNLALAASGVLAVGLVAILGLCLWAATIPPPEPMADVPAGPPNRESTSVRPPKTDPVAAAPHSPSVTAPAVSKPPPTSSTTSSSSSAVIPAPTNFVPTVPRRPLGPTTVSVRQPPEPEPTLPPDQDPIIARVDGNPNDRHPASHHLQISAHGDAVARFTSNGGSRFHRISDRRGLGGSLLHGAALANDAAAFAMLKDDEIQISNFDQINQPKYWHNTGQARCGVFSSDMTHFVASLEGKEPLQIFNLATRKVEIRRTTLREITWLGVLEDRLVCWSPEKKAEASLIRFDTIRQRLDGTLDFPPLLLRTVRDVPTAYALRQNGSAVSIGCWNLKTGKIYTEAALPGIGNAADIVGLSHDGAFLAVRSGSDLALVRLPGGPEVCRIEFPASTMYPVVLATAESLLAFSCPDADICLLSLPRLLAQPRWRAMRRGDQHILTPVLTDSPAADVAKPSTPELTSSGATARVTLPMSDELGRQAIATLRAAGMQLGDNPQQIKQISTRGTNFTATHAPLLAQFPLLNRLDLTESPEAASILQSLPSLPALRSLVLDFTEVTDDDLQHVSTFPSLQSLKLKGTKIQGPGLAHLRELHELDHISLPENLPRTAIAPLSELTQLKGVDFWPTGITDDDLRQVAGMKMLTHLDLQRANLAGPGLAHLAELPRLRMVLVPEDLPREGYPHLGKLSLESFVFPRDSGDEHLAAFASNAALRDVTLPSKTTDAGLHVLTTLPALRNISMRYATEITDEGLGQLAGCRAKSIYLPPQISDAGIAGLTVLVELEILDAGETNIGNRGAAALQGLDRLTVLILGENVGDGCVGPLAELPALKQLSFRKSPLSSAGLAGLAKLPALKELGLVQMSLGDAEVESLKQLKQLKILTFHQMPELAVHIESLKQALPGCAVLTY